MPSAQPPLVADSHGLAGGDDLNPHPAVAGRPVAARHGPALNGKGEQEQETLALQQFHRRFRRLT